MNNWLTQATGAISTAARPVVPINLDFSTTKFNTFFGQIEQMFAAGFRPTDVIMPNVSFNDLGNYGTGAIGRDYLQSQMQARLIRGIEMCRRYGAKVYVYTDFRGKLGGTTSAADMLNTYMYNLALQLDAAGACKVIDFQKKMGQRNHDRCGCYASDPGRHRVHGRPHRSRSNLLIGKSNSWL